MVIKTVDASSKEFILENICDKNRKEYVIEVNETNNGTESKIVKKLG